MQYLLAAGIAVVLFLSGFVSGCRWAQNEPETVTKIEYIDRQIRVTDTLTVDRPVTRRLYERLVDTVQVCRPAPQNFNPYGFIPRNPVKINRESFVISYWQPDSLRWIQDIYRLRQPKWGLYIDAGAERGVIASQADVRVTARFKRSTAYAGYGLAEWMGEPYHGIVFGGRVHLIGWK